MSTFGSASHEQGRLPATFANVCWLTAGVTSCGWLWIIDYIWPVGCVRKSRTSGDDHSGNKSTRLHACSEEPLHYVPKLVRKHKKVPNSTLWTRIEHVLVLNPCNYSNPMPMLSLALSQSWSKCYLISRINEGMWRNLSIITIWILRFAQHASIYAF